jgi:UPF0755 protein
MSDDDLDAMLDAHLADPGDDDGEPGTVLVDHRDARVPSDADEHRTGAREQRRRRRHRRSRRRRALLIVLLVVGIPVLALLGVLRWWQHELDGGTPGHAVALSIGPGSSVKHIGDELQHDKVIGSSLAFQVYARLGGHNKYEAGDYTLSQNIGIRRAVSALERGPQSQDRQLRVVPDLYLDQVAAQVHEQLGLDANAFVQAVRSGADGTITSPYLPSGVHSLEGLLYPDTYRIARGATVNDVIRTMVRRFDQIADSVGLSATARAQNHTPYQLIVIASIIEREAKIDSDRPLIASVIANRLHVGMPLQIDATRLYAQRFHAPTYDTYAVHGLPPGPITTPTLASLRGAAHPATTTYIYYVLYYKNGGHKFSSTPQQFEQDVAAAKKNGLLG